MKKINWDISDWEENDNGIFLNFYTHCDHSWETIHAHIVNEKCPYCGCEIQPYKSEDLENYED